MARLAKKEADQRATAKQATDLAEAKRLQAEAQAAEAAKRKADEEAARLAKAQAEAEHRATMETERQAKAKAQADAKAAAEAERMRAKELEIARKVMADSEKAARESQERQAREAAQEAARAQAEERRRLEAERQKWEPVGGGFFRRLFGGGSSEPKPNAPAPAVPVAAVPTVPVVQPTQAVPVPQPVAPPVPNIPMPLLTIGSAGMSAMQAPGLKSMMVGQLGDPQALHHQELFDCIATGVFTVFGTWLTSTMVTKVLGTGPVPTFAPPYVPIGPVVGGTANGPPSCLT